MEVVSLNCWYGKAWDELEPYLKEKAKSTDVFLFQEVSASRFLGRVSPEGFRWDLLNKLKEVLSQYGGFYTPLVSGVGFDYKSVVDEITWGQAVFVGSHLKVISAHSICVYGEPVNFLNEDLANFPVAIQGLRLSNDEKVFNVFNFHGTHLPGDKLDTPQRLRQSQSVLDFMRRYPGIKILGGDFNLMPDTQSIKMIEDAGYRDLIKDFGVECTRSPLNIYWDSKARQLFADYMFVGGGVRVKEFRAEEVLVSDHLPLVLDFDLEN